MGEETPKKSLLQKVRDFLLKELPVGIIYLSQGVQVSTTVLIRDLLSEEGEDYLILANGSLIPLRSVVGIYSHPIVDPTMHGRNPFDDEIGTFQLHK